MFNNCVIGKCLAKGRTRQVRILVIDDDEDMRDLIQSKLENFQLMEVTTAANGEEGLEKAVNARPDVILLDITMPVMNGLEMLKQLRNAPDLIGVPVIMCTKCFGVNDITNAAACNISAYIAKPFDFRELMDKISECLDK